MTILPQKNVACIDSVLNVVGGGAQGMVIAYVSQTVASQKADLAAKIDEGIHFLQTKYASRFSHGVIHPEAEACIGACQAYWKEYQDKIVPQIQAYYRLNPPETRRETIIHHNPLRKYQRGDVYEGK